ncbi:PAS domain S-box protein [bacterium]|nr:PAS domain S-box protein [bacterium]
MTASVPAHILLVDDQPANLLALEAILGDLGVNLVRAESGEEALKRLLEADFAAILLDVRMPGLGGFEVAHLVRARPRSRATPIVFITAEEPPAATVVEAYRLGAVDFLVKPLVPAVVRGKVAAFADLYREKERARAESEHFRLLVQGTTDYAIFMLDPEGRVATWNAGAERLKGYAATDIVGRHFSRFYPPEDIARGWPDEELRRAVAEGRFEDEGWRVRKDGTRFWANVVITALRDARGELRGFSKVTRDLTERRNREEELRRLNNDLERRVEERTAELRDKESALREANRRKDEFLATLAHELRNPLAPIRNGLAVLKLRPAPEAAARVVDMMDRQLGQLVHLVDDLLDVSRVSSGKVVLRPERLDLREVVGATVEAGRPAVEAHRHTLVVHLPDAPVWVDGDRTRLVQVLTNLLNNAAKYTPDGGRIVLTAVTEGGHAVVRVADTGLGIPADMLPKVFEAFTQVDRSLDRAQGGLGLGLALVKQLVVMHGGAVWAESPGADRGSTFRVRLPLAEDAVAR